MLPLKDLNRSSTTPHINRLLLLANIVIFTVYWLSSQNIILDPRFADDIIGYDTVPGKFVMVPNEIVQGQRLYTIFTSMFMHASWLHLLGNMLFLFIFGDNIEDTFGHIGYLAFYLFCGIAATFTHIASIILAPAINGMLGLSLSSDLTIPVIGASGAISGVLGAYLILYPRARILTFIVYIILPIPAIAFLGFWFLMQFVYGIYDLSGGVAYFAHIGGFIAGMLLALTIGKKMKKAREKRLRI